jgi:hypothetical protein
MVGSVRPGQVAVYAVGCGPACSGVSSQRWPRQARGGSGPRAETTPPVLNQLGDVGVGLLAYGYCRLQWTNTHGWLGVFRSSPGSYLGDPSPIALARPPPFQRPTKLAARMGPVTRREECHFKPAHAARTSFAGGTGHVTEDRGHRR